MELRVFFDTNKSDIKPQAQVGKSDSWFIKMYNFTGNCNLENHTFLSIIIKNSSG
jgi:hypothetical protein